jgi:hypothetical protein
MSDEKKQKSRGLGDTVKKAIKVTTFGLVKQKPGCGCKGRQAWLNKKFPYKWYREALKASQATKVNKQSGENETIKAHFAQATEELLTPEQKKLREELMKQRLSRASSPVGTPATQGTTPEKKCAPCEAARIERERLAALEKNQPDTTES